MPQVVLHILVPLIIMALIKDWYDTKKGKGFFSLHYVLIAGIAGILPDLDIALFWVLFFFGFSLTDVHRTFAHTLFVPILFLIASGVSRFKIRKTIGRHNLRWSIIFLMIAFGSFIHLILDSIFSNGVAFFYPISTITFGLNLISYFPSPLDSLLIPSIEGALLIMWLIYLELRHKISDFI